MFCFEQIAWRFVEWFIELEYINALAQHFPRLISNASETFCLYDAPVKKVFIFTYHLYSYKATFWAKWYFLFNPFNMQKPCDENMRNFLHFKLLHPHWNQIHFKFTFLLLHWKVISCIGRVFLFDLRNWSSELVKKNTNSLTIIVLMHFRLSWRMLENALSCENKSWKQWVLIVFH